MKLDEDQKFQALLAELQERYHASHKMRERSVQFTLWISGMGIGLGWLLISQTNLVMPQRIALTLLILALFACTLYFIFGLRRGFDKNRNTLIRCEKALGLFETGLFLEDASILPSEYQGIKIRWSDHFSTLCLWLGIVAVALLILTWSPTYTGVQPETKNKIEHVRRK